ncbi:MAG: hypothetical protein H6766_02760 [Candidatus Peribacteria bacterium]|nr:MAG: hypothetical protein H6766_02760 [Candidatus Peribacteria bacterium]
MITYNAQNPNNRARFADRDEQQDIIRRLDALFLSFDNVKKEDANRALKYHLPNGVRWSVRSHHKYVILGLCQGAKLIADEPLL